MPSRDQQPVSESLAQEDTDTLLVRMLIGPSDRIQTEFRAWRSATDFDTDIVDDRYNLMALLYRRLKDAGIDDPLMARLKGIYKRQWAEYHHSHQVFLQMFTQWRNQGLSPFPGCGFSLQSDFYKEPWTRPANPLDVAMPRDDLLPALRVLREMGWHGCHFEQSIPWGTETVQLWDGRALSVRLNLHALHAVPFAHADAWFRAQPVDLPLPYASIQRAGDSGLLLATLLKDEGNHSATSIQWIVDAAMIIRRGGVDWENLAQFAQDQKIARRIAVSLRILCDRYELPVPTYPINQLGASPIRFIEWAEAASTQVSSPAPKWLDHWRYLRGQGFGAFTVGYARLLARQAGVRNPRWILAPCIHRARGFFAQLKRHP